MKPTKIFGFIPKHYLYVVYVFVFVWINVTIIESGHKEWVKYVVMDGNFWSVSNGE